MNPVNLKVTLLSAASTLVLAACSSQSPELQEDLARQQPVVPLVQAPRQASDPALPERPVSGAIRVEPRVDEVAVTGARVASSQAQGAAEASYDMASPGYVQPAFVQPPWAKHAPLVPGQGERYESLADNGVISTRVEPLSTFSIDVDTGSYSNVRRFLDNGQLPPVDAVRTEELVNYFSYDYTVERGSAAPFTVYTEVAPSPWHTGRHLLHVGIQAVAPEADAVPARNLVFLVDVSGSMQQPDKLPLLVSSLKLLTKQLQAEDRIALVVYAGAAGVVLEPTAGDQQGTIMRALEQLQAGGSTNGTAGIEEAYALAEEHFVEGGINRVLLATDGDFNVGLSDVEALKKLIEAKRKSGISLTTLGFGGGNYNDHLMEQLADIGNGNYAYIDSINEARKVLVDELSATLQTVAKDVKIQIEFNPAQVAEYRLVGYENRVLANADFNNDKVDAGEIGAGHTVTALYELTLVGSEASAIDPLRYGAGQVSTPVQGRDDELAFLKLRYKAPDGEVSQLIERPVLARQIIDDLAQTSDNYRFAAAVAGLGQLLRESEQLSGFDYDQALALGNSARGADPFGYRAEFLNLLRTAQLLAEN